jgi:hypothetical protein
MFGTHHHNWFPSNNVSWRTVVQSHLRMYASAWLNQKTAAPQGWTAKATPPHDQATKETPPKGWTAKETLLQDPSAKTTPVQHEFWTVTGQFASFFSNHKKEWVMMMMLIGYRKWKVAYSYSIAASKPSGGRTMCIYVSVWVHPYMWAILLEWWMNDVYLCFCVDSLFYMWTIVSNKTSH